MPRRVINAANPSYRASGGDVERLENMPDKTIRARDISLPELCVRACRALIRELGLVGMARFLSRYNGGKGDYTRDRHLWLDQLDPDEEWASIMRLQEEAKAKTTAKTAKRRPPRPAKPRKQRPSAALKST